MIRVLLADDQTLVRQGICSLLRLSPNISVVAEARDGSEVLPLLESVAVDVILLDLQMPAMDGVQVLGALNEAGIRTPTIVLTTFDDDTRLLKCANLNARGYMLKDASYSQLVTAIEKVFAGEDLIKHQVRKDIANRLREGNVPSSIQPAPYLLTARERQVLRYMASGCSNREIGEAVHLSEGTVKNHVSNILAKMGVRDRTRAVIKALEHGWLD
jgi:DNA-binding NarL/FixJ family response regulator